MDDTPDYAPLLDRGVQLRIQAKALEEEAKAMRNESTQLFSVALTVSGETKLSHERGSVQRIIMPRKNLDQGKLAQVLVAKGVQAQVVADSIEESTTTKEIEVIKFVESKSTE